MTEHITTSPPTYGAGSTYGHHQSTDGRHNGTGQEMKEQARQVGQNAARAGEDVAHTAKEQGREVVAEATRQVRDLYGEARQHLRGQAGTQQRRAAGGLRSVAGELRAMADQGGQSGPA